MVFTFSFPIVLLVIFGAVFGGDDRRRRRHRRARYFVAGMIAAGIVSTSFQSLGDLASRSSATSGALKRLRGTPMPPLGVLRRQDRAGRSSSRRAETCCCSRSACCFYGLDLPDRRPSRWLTFAWIFVLGLAACSLLGIAFTALVPKAGSAPAVITPIVRSCCSSSPASTSSSPSCRRWMQTSPRSSR